MFSIPTDQGNLLMSIAYTTRGANAGGTVKAIMQNLAALTPTENVWDGIAGNNGLNLAEVAGVESIGFNQRAAVHGAIEAVNDHTMTSRLTDLGTMVKQMAGFETFSHSLDQGSASRQKAATLDLNARANRQWAGAEALYKTVVVGYKEEGISLPIDIAGVGAYNVSGNVNESWEDLRPIASVLSDSKFNPGDDLKLVPVKPTNASDPNAKVFVADADWPSWDVTYDGNDLLKREAHKTNFLQPVRINNLLNLCRAPGAVAFEQNDEIESNSLKLTRVLIKLKTGAAEANVVLNTANMSGNSMRPSNSTTSDEKRALAFVITGENIKNFFDKNDKNVDLFKALTDLGYSVHLAFDINATYQRGTKAFSPTTSAVSIGYLVSKDGDKVVPGTPGMPDDVQLIIDGLNFEGSIIGLETKQVHNNVNRSRYGTTVVYGTVNKFYNVQRRTPISVKYPMLNEDNNAEVLGRLVKDMNTMVTRNMSHDAFKAANEHFAYVYANHGAKIVDINNDSSSVMPGQHFLSTTGIKSTMDLIKEVSTLDSKDTRENISEALVSKLWDVITALRISSNTAALKELDGRKEAYTVVAHASLAPFLMTQGDYRTFGANIKFEIVETNVDSEIGRMWVVPTSLTTDNEIDIFGGIGICVAKELLVVEGSVMQSDRQYRMILTQPAYQHHSLCPVVGLVEIADMDKLLGDEGLITAVNKHLVNVSGKLTDPNAPITTSREVPITKVP